MAYIVKAVFGSESIVKTDTIYQYNSGQVLQVEGLAFTNSTEFHLAIHGKDTASIITGTIANNIAKITIPEVLMINDFCTCNYRIDVFVYVIDNDSGYTKYKIIIPVKSRPRPKDYYVDLPTVPELKSLKQELNTAVNNFNDAYTEIDQLKSETASLKEDLGEKETQLTDIQQKMSDSDSNDGFLLCDLNGNIVGHIASFEVWNNESYNKKYGWGGHPYGNGKLPPYSKIAGIFEADLLSVCGGKGRWNKDDTGNFQHGGHLFEGWNAEEDVRLTFGIGTKNKDIAWIQTFHAATQEGSDSGAYYCVTKVGSDIDNQGMNFMPSITQSRSLFSLKVGDNLSPNSKHIQELVETGELVDWEYNKTDMIPYGTMYFDYTKDKVRVYTRTGGWKYLKFEEEEV